MFKPVAGMAVFGLLFIGGWVGWSMHHLALPGDRIVSKRNGKVQLALATSVHNEHN